MPTNISIQTPERLPKLHCEEIQKAATFLIYKNWDKCGLELLKKIVQKANADESYCLRFKHFLESDESTILLRELCNPFGFYWNSSDLEFSGAVDALDTAFGITRCNENYPQVFPSLETALSNADFIKVDGIMHKVNTFYGGSLFYKEQATGKECSIPLSEFKVDIHSNPERFELLSIKPSMYN